MLAEKKINKISLETLLLLQKKINLTTRLIVLFKFNFWETDCKRNFVTVIDRSITSYAHLQTKKIAFFLKLPLKKKGLR